MPEDAVLSTLGLHVCFERTRNIRARGLVGG